MKVYIIDDGIEKYLIRSCLKDKVEFGGFVGINETRGIKGDDFTILTFGFKHLLYLNHDEVLKQHSIFFYQKRNLMDSWFNSIVKKKDWLYWMAIHVEDVTKNNQHFRRKIMDACVREMSKDKDGEKVVIIGTSNQASKYKSEWKDILWGIIPSGNTHTSKHGGVMREYEDLFYEDIARLHFFIENDKEYFITAGKLLELGALADHIHSLNHSRMDGGTEKLNMIDPIVGYSRKSEFPGYAVFGDGGENSFRILTLGGSTSDPKLNNIKSYSEYLYEILTDMGLDVTIYAGGIASYSVPQECLKLMKDGLILHPNIVISYSAFNDTADPPYNEPQHPFIRSYFARFFNDIVSHKRITNDVQHSSIDGVVFGVQDDESNACIWHRCERMMHGMCQEYGIPFYAFIQPWNENVLGDTGIKIIRDDARDKYIKDIYAEIMEINAKDGRIWMHDWTRIYDKERTPYIDGCHVYEPQNRMLAKEMLPYVLNELYRLTDKKEMLYA